MGIALDLGEGVDPHRAGLAHAPEVVAPQVHEHDVLGALLRVRAQFGLEPRVLLGGASARTGSGDGAGGSGASGEFDEFLRRGADEGLAAEAQEEVVGRRIHQPERPVERQGRHRRFGSELLRGNDLDDLPGADVLFALLDDGLVFRRGHFGFEGVGMCRRGGRFLLFGEAPGDGFGAEQAFAERVDLGARRGIGPRGVVPRVRRDRDEDGLAHVVEDDERIRQEEGGERRARFAHEADARHEVPHRVVGEIADGAALEGREFRRGGEFLPGEACAHAVQRVRRTVLDEDLLGVEPEIGVASADFAAVDAFQKKDVLLVRNARQHGDGSLAIGEEFAKDRGARTVRRARDEFLFAQFFQHIQLLF